MRVDIHGKDPSGVIRQARVDTSGNLRTSIVDFTLSGCTITEYDVATDDDVTISAAPCLLLGIYINVVLSAHAVNVMDAAVTKLILPASMAAGSKIDCHGAIFATSLVINSDNAATGKILFFWRAI